jgi:hypothetical protein
MSIAEAFEPLRSALDSARVRFAIGGSWASTAYGDTRFTNDVDILADFSEATLREFFTILPPTYYFDPDSAFEALRLGRPFNVLYSPTVMKFDFFPAAAFPLGRAELDRAIPLAPTGLSQAATPFVSPEDIVLAKLHWFRLGGEISQVQWRDLEGIVRLASNTLDREYLERSAEQLDVRSLLHRLIPPTLG